MEVYGAISGIHTGTDTIETRIAEVKRDRNGILIVTMKDCGEVDEFDVMDLNLAIRHIAQHKMAYKLIIATAGFDLTRKAKEMSRKEDNISKTIARAIVVSNRIKASLFNFIKQFDNKTYPQQFFTSKAQAYDWLLKLKAEAEI
jgi:hypothetical protein